MDGGIKLWLRADDGSVADSLWTDYSGNGIIATQSTVGNRPSVTTAATNFNPALTFDGTTDVLDLSSPALGTGDVPYSIFTVGTPASVSGGYHYMYVEGANATNQRISVGRVDNRMVNANYLNDIVGTTNSVVASETAIYNWTKVANTAGGQRAQNKNNLSINSDVNTGFNKQNAYQRIGSSSGAEYWDGKMNEVIVYNRVLTATEAQKVNSYLALKYGITIDQTVATDYIASDGSNIWDASDNGAYKVDIAGLGKDICTGLDQKQSKSVNANSLITMALGGSVASSNAANPNTITNDKSFFVWANNGLAITFTTAFTKTGSTINLRTPRIWQVDRTNWADQNITICVGQTGERSLIIDNGLDADFADDAETSVHALDFSTGCVTINSSLLPDGAHFSLGTEIKGPACVDAGVVAWLRADYGVIDDGSGKASSWSDYSGNSKNFTQGTAANRPAINSVNAYSNFNPTVYFNSVSSAEYLASATNLWTAGQPGSGFAAAFHQNVTDSWGHLIDQNDEPTLLKWAGIPNMAVYDNGTIATPTTSPALPTLQNNITSVVGIDFGTTANSYNLYFNAVSGAVTHAPAPSVVNNAMRIGLQVDNTDPWRGGIHEVIIYNRELTAIELQRVNSYLALKYGVTLTTDNDGDATAFETISGSVTEGDYVASDGMTIYWDASANSAYHNSVAGIGKDMCTELLQKQSKSVNTGEILTVALGSVIETTNALNTNPITDDVSFLVWGHNNGSTDFSSDAGGTNATVRMDRVWRVQRTDWTDQNITMKFDGYDDESYLIIHPTDPTFAAIPLEYQLSATGEVTFNTSDLPDGAYFTLGKNLIGPACVDGGIQVWLRADQGVATSGTEVTTWSDFSNNGNTPTTVSTPDFTENSVNFNPAVSFQGVTTDEYFNFGTLTNGFTQAQAFVVTFQDNADVISDNETGLWRIGGNSNTHNVLTNELLYESFGNNARIDALATPEGSEIPHLYSASQSSSNQANLYWNALNFHTSARTTLFPNEEMWLGKNRASNRYKGDIVEFILYNRVLTAAEQQRVNSYLALKYGITIDQTTNTDYLASDDSKMWENDSDGFEYDIAGIGKDECTELHQKQSTSVNSDDVVTFAVGSHTVLPATNVANTSPVTNDLSFFTWANDNGNTDVFSTAVTATNAELRMARIWKVDKFNWQDQDITLCFDGQIGERYVLIDNNSATLASVDKEIPLDPLTGCATFNSSELDHGYYFSLGTKILAPGCADNGDILTWLRADYGASSTQWNDFSGRTTHARQTAVADTPTIAVTAAYMNFNPAVDFDGGDFMNFDILGQNLNINPTETDRDPITVLTVYQADVLSRPLWGNDNNGADRELYMHQVNNGTSLTPFSGGNIASQSKILTTILDEGLTNGSFIYADGVQVLNFTESGSDGGLTNTMLGRSWTGQGDGAMFDGRIAEFAVYRGALTTAQRQQAESYLAIKYGITLDQSTPTDYIASDGTTLMWDASVNTGYSNDIAGIGRDTCTALNQKQSHSANSDYLVTMALGTAVETTNTANANVFTNDLSFLTWGNNDGLISFTDNQTGSFVNARLGRIWKVQKSVNWDDAQDVTLCFNGFDEDSYLLISDANNFATLDLEQQLDASGCTTINSALLENADFFTLGTDVAGPGCVNPGIAMWLRADAGTMDGTLWQDQSGNDLNAAQGTMTNEPTLTAGAINFNPAMVFDGADNFMELAPLNGLPYDNADRTIISVGFSSNTSGNRWIFSYGTNTTSDANFWGNRVQQVTTAALMMTLLQRLIGLQMFRI
ncbi:MAG: hypothetical protein IPJ74_19460 [Saprospiraceae bacterium]|nr:hypothetical protein [Saprospiraceae bacterium]